VKPRGLERALALARGGRLYPSVILHGGGEPLRREAALDLARALLCEAPPEARPCGACRHCARIAWPGGESERFHPDVAVLERDLKTSTSVEATRSLLRGAQVLPFEARGQVFVVASADTLSGEASDALLKAIEEPGLGSPRHFLLLAPSRLDLAATLRSRSLAVFLGPAEGWDTEEIEPLAADLAASLVAYWKGGGGICLVAAAQRLARIGGFEDPRAARPWTLAAAAARDVALREVPPAGRRALLALAEELLVASALRLRGIAAERIFEGLVARHLAPTKGVAGRAGG
jgi:hypothetical protein